MEALYDKLTAYAASDVYPCHMPGHKRNMTDRPMEDCYKIDITEIDGFDNLHQPLDILLDLKNRVSRLYGSEESFLLVNGSTGGILSAISAAFRRGDRILAGRNCHKSVYHGIFLNGLRAEYVYPPFVEEYGICGSISPGEIKRKLDEDPDIRGVLLTSPTYDGVVSDIREIVRIAHEKKIPVIVDEAHGAHFAFDKRFPESALRCGADLVIHSIHKTLPALTQTAILHTQGDLIDRDRLKRFLQIYQTSSPSYILLSGIDQWARVMENEAKELCGGFFERNGRFEEKSRRLRHLRIPSSQRMESGKIYRFDPGKKLLIVRGCKLTGRKLYRLLLEKYHLQMEMAGWDYVTAIMTIMDREEGFERLADAAAEIDRELEPEMGEGAYSENEAGEYPEPFLDIAAAMEAEREDLLLEDCENRISAEFVHIYPPGIPLIVPGERFTKGLIRRLLQYREHGFTIEGLKEKDRRARVVKGRLHTG